MIRVSVIIPAFNEEDVIRECLESLKSQSYQEFDVHIIDDCSTDQTASIIQEFVRQQPERFSIHQFGKVGPGRARNLIAQKSASEILAFMDADCAADPEWLKNIVEPFSDSSVASVGGPNFAAKTSSDFQLRLEKFFGQQRRWTDFHKGDAPSKEVPHNPLCNVAYRREMFIELGGFREDIFPGEDLEFDYRLKKLGKRILYHEKAIVFHHRPENILQFRKVMFAYGRAQGKLLREYGPFRRLHWLALLSLTLIALIFVFLINQVGAWTLIISFLFILLFVFFRPNAHSWLSIYWNGLEWMNGFVTGLLTNSATPPFFKKNM